MLNEYWHIQQLFCSVGMKPHENPALKSVLRYLKIPNIFELVVWGRQFLSPNVDGVDMILGHPD